MNTKRAGWEVALSKYGPWIAGAVMLWGIIETHDRNVRAEAFWEAGCYDSLRPAFGTCPDK